MFCFVREYFEALGFYPPRSPNEQCKFNRRNLFYIFALVGMVFSVTGFLLFNATSTYEYSMSFYMSVVLIGLTVYCTVFIYKIGSILQLIKNYEEFMAKRTEYKPASTFRYVKLNEKIELMSKCTHIFLVKILFFGVIVPFLLLFIIGYYIYDFGDESFILPWPMLLPFNWKTSIGYLIGLSLEAVTLHSALFCFTSMISFFIGSAWVIICALEDITNDLIEFNANETPTKSHKRLKECFCHIIRFYSDAKQFIGNFNQNYEYIIATLFLYSLLSLTSSLIVFISQSGKNSNLIEIILTLNMLSFSILSIFFFCEFGEMVGNQLNTFDEKLWQCDWYAFPIEVQKLLLSSTQRSMVFRGYGNIECTRDSFKKTINGGFSYFMTLKKIAG